MRRDRDDHSHDRGRREDSDNSHNRHDKGESSRDSFEHNRDRGFPDVVDTLSPPPRPDRGNGDGRDNG
ncbi:hypothetical protein D3C85_1010550 [compost metagenome]